MMRGALLVAAGLIGWLLVQRAEDALPAPAPLSVADLDLSGVFRESPDHRQAREHGERVACLCDALVKVLALDAAAAKPRIVNGGYLEDLRIQTVLYLNQELKTEDVLPGFGRMVGDFLDDRLGDDATGPLTDATRRKWSDALRDIGRASRAAAGRL